MLQEYLLQEAHPGPWLVKKNVVSNRDSLAVDFVKAACLDFLPEEVPYKLKYKLLYFEDDGGMYILHLKNLDFRSNMCYLIVLLIHSFFKSFRYVCC